MERAVRDLHHQPAAVAIRRRASVDSCEVLAFAQLNSLLRCSVVNFPQRSLHSIGKRRGVVSCDFSAAPSNEADAVP